MRKKVPEFGGLGLVLVDQRLPDIVGGVKLGRLLDRSVGLGLGVVARKSAAVFGLDGPDAPLVVHLRPGILANTPNELRVSRRGSWLLRRHCFSLSVCFCSPSSCKTLILMYAPQTHRFPLNGPGFLNLTQLCFGLLFVFLAGRLLPVSFILSSSTYIQL